MDGSYLPKSSPVPQKFSELSGDFNIRPEKYFEPKNIDELRQILCVARLHNQPLSVLGCGWWYRVGGYLISLRHLDKVLQVDHSASTVLVQSGIRLSELYRRLSDDGLSLEVFPLTTDITVGEALSFGSHGSGSKVTSLSSCVISLQLMTCNGDFLTLSRDDESAEFNAACCNLGALGVIITVTLQCTPRFYVKRVTQGIDLQQLLEHLPVHLSASEYFSFVWYPYTGSAVVSHSNRCHDNIIATPKVSWYRRLWEYLIDNYLMKGFIWLSTFLPWLRIHLSRFCISSRRVVAGPGHEVLASQAPSGGEWVVPGPQAALAVYELQQWVLGHPSPVLCPVTVTFSAPSSDLLSPAYHRDVCYLSLPACRSFRSSLTRTKLETELTGIVTRAGGTVCWSSRMPDQLERSAVHNQYPELNKFKSIREKLDPEGMFLNNALRTVLGLD